jgi:heterodisulfide reductase subunit D
MERLAQLRRATGAARCIACGKCTSMCPLAGQEGMSARRIAAEDLEDQLAGRGAGVGRCLTCGSCEVRCPQGVHFTDYVRGLRERIPLELHRPAPHGGAFQSAARSMAAGPPPARDLSWIGDPLEIASEGEVALFVGCLPLFDAYFGADLDVHPLDIARAAIRLLNGAGIRPVVLSDERCCGHDLLWNGEREAFIALARENAKAFQARGVKRIVTACGECCRTWRLDYPEAAPGYAPRVEHVAELVASSSLAFRTNGERTLTYQDPCRLGRHLGVVDAPRNVLASLPGAELVDMPRSGKDAVCCGTSGFIHCDAASRAIQRERLEEAEGTGAETLVTACPKCLIHFHCAQAEARRTGAPGPQIEVQDFTVLAASYLADAGGAR